MNSPARIIDAHHHLWDLSHCHYPWLMERGVKRFFGDPAPIQQDYLPVDFVADHDGLPISHSVHIQVGVSEEDAVKETLWLQDCSDQYGFPGAIVAFCDLTSPDFQEQLDAHNQAANLRGVRQIVGRSAEEDAKTGSSALLNDPKFAARVRALGKRGLSFDLQLTPPLMQAAAELFNRVPETPVALCHCGSLSDFSPDGLAQWRSGLEALSEHPNMICKISGFGMFDHDWTVDSIRDSVLRVIDIFGSDRVAFGSNFPVDKLYASYAETFGAYLKITEGFSESERQSMFHDVAEQFYRM